ncbi:FAD/NAD(P)-binding domain-containing protein [Aspergillus californicus]
MATQPQISIAIIGGGPGGLATAISLSKLPFLSVTLYEKHPEPREAGAGISLSSNAWKVLDLLSASDGVKGGSKTDTHHRNAYSGDILNVTAQPENAAGDYRGAIRARRTRLQSALLAKVPEGIIQFSKKLIRLEDLLGGGGVRLGFEDGSEVVADLVVGADGIHSIVRKALFPEHHLHFTGNTAFRVLVPKARLAEAHLTDITATTSWWWGKTGHLYFSDVDDTTEEPTNPLFEITIRSYNEPSIPGTTVPWGIPATAQKIASRVQSYDARIRDAVSLVDEGEWREFATFAGPRLDTITGWNKVALIGDASHPLSGAFGSGATFAMEDGWILARALEYAHARFPGHGIGEALEIFQQIRAPYYAKMYTHLDETSDKMQKLQAENERQDFHAALRIKIDNFLYGDKDFIYKNDIGKVWDEYIAGKQARL